MSDKITRTQRWLDLIALLLGRKIPLTVDEIMERVPAYAAAWREGGETARASVRRMFERDKKDLLQLGIPLTALKYRINSGAEELEGYRLQHKDFYLPYLRLLGGDGAVESPPLERRYRELPALDLSPAEAQLAFDALHRARELPAFPFAAEARSALRKLSFDVDAERFPEEPLLWVEPPGAREVLERLRVLSDALLARKRVRFLYHGIYRGADTRRDVAPYGLFFQRDWYLVAHDAARDDLRVFRVARMEELEPNAKAPGTPDYEIPADFRLQDYLDRSAWELGDGDDAVRAEVRFRFPRSLQAAQRGEGELVREEEGGDAVRRFRVSQTNPFLRWVLGQAGEAEILSPPELREACEAMLREVAALYAEADHG